MKSLLIFGGNGFVGSAASKFAVSQGLNVISVSRTGKPKRPEPWQKSVKHVKGDIMDHKSYSSYIPQVSGVIHSIGLLLDSQSMCSYEVNERTYEYINRDSAYKVCELLENKDKTFVYISLDKAPIFLPRLISTKREVEDYLANNRDKIPSAVLRPGVIYSNDEYWRQGASFIVDLANKAEPVAKGLGLNWIADNLIPSRTLNVDLVGKVAVLCATIPELRSMTLDVDGIEKIAQEYHSIPA